MNNRDETREALMALLSEVTDRVEKIRSVLDPLRPDGPSELVALATSVASAHLEVNDALWRVLDLLAELQREQEGDASVRVSTIVTRLSEALRRRRADKEMGA